MVQRPIPTTISDDDLNRVVERPDGFYWQPLEGGREHGPFATLLDATLDMQSGDEDDEQLIDSDDVRDAEDVLGVPDWVDPDTGQLADDGWTRTEDH